MKYTLRINGQPQQVEAEEDDPLLWVLREQTGLCGTKFGCGLGQCGACTVLVDGAAMRSCTLPASAVGDAPVATIEAMEQDAIGRHVQAAWLHLGVVQCGYCQSGQIMSAVALLRANKTPSDADIDDALSGNLCRCGTYQRIRSAIHDAAARIRADG